MFVSIDDVRTHMRALLLEQTDPRGSYGPPEIRNATACYRRYWLRGFLTDARLPTFDLIVPSFDYELVDLDVSQAGARSAPASTAPATPDPARCGMLRIEGCDRRIQLDSDVNSNRGIRVMPIPDHEDITQVWKILRSEVARYWTAPYMPVAHFVDADHERATLRANFEKTGDPVTR